MADTTRPQIQARIARCIERLTALDARVEPYNKELLVTLDATNQARVLSAIFFVRAATRLLSSFDGMDVLSRVAKRQAIANGLKEEALAASMEKVLAVFVPQLEILLTEAEHLLVG